MQDNALANADRLDALISCAEAFAQSPDDSETLEKTCQALLSAVENDADLDRWNSQEKTACYAALVSQTECAKRPLIFAHEVAARLTAGEHSVTKKLVKELSPTLRKLFANGPDAGLAFKNFVVFVVTMRAHLGEIFTSAQISQLHIDTFEAFEPADLGLPYSVMFNDDLFGQNRIDLAKAYLGQNGKLENQDQLSPTQILFFEWLFGKQAISTPLNLERFLQSETQFDEAQTSAIGSLLLRHLPRDVVANTQLDATPFEPLSDLAKYVATHTSDLPRGSDADDLEKYQRKTYLARQAVRQKLRLAVPALRRGRKPKVAICLSGQMRGYQAALQTWKRTLLPEIEATFFIHSWFGIGRSDAQPFRYVLPFEGQNFSDAYRKVALDIGYTEMRKHYAPLFAALADGDVVSAETLSDTFQTDHVILEDDGSKKFANFSNQQKMHYKIHAANAMANDASDFDLHIRMRPDLPVNLTAFNWADMVQSCQKQPVLFAEKPFGVHYDSLMIGDQFAIGAPETMKVYSDTWAHFPHLAKAGLTGCPAEFTGHISLAQVAWIFGLEVEKCPIRFSNLQDAQPLATKDIIHALKASGPQTEAYDTLLAAAQSDLRS